MFIIFINPSARAGYDTRSIFKRSLTGLNSEFSFSYSSCLTKAEEPSLSYYLPIAGGLDSYLSLSKAKRLNLIIPQCAVIVTNLEYSSTTSIYRSVSIRSIFENIRPPLSYSKISSGPESGEIRADTYLLRVLVKPNRYRQL